jgi:hypothetical protein
MPDYSKGRIYKIVSENTDKVYIGSTTVQYLCKRLGNHKAEPVEKGCTSKQILDYGDVKIIEIEKYPCNSKKELEERESYLIKNTENFVNKIIPVRSKEELREMKKIHDKKYYENNKEKWTETRNNNKDKINEQARIRRANNPELWKEKDKKRYDNMTQEQREKQNERHRKMYANRTPEQKEAKLQYQREWRAKKKAELEAK